MYGKYTDGYCCCMLSNYAAMQADGQAVGTQSLAKSRIFALHAVVEIGQLNVFLHFAGFFNCSLQIGSKNKFSHFLFNVLFLFFYIPKELISDEVLTCNF